MIKPYLVVTSIANDKHEILKILAKESTENNVHFIVIGDTKSPKEFQLSNCDFYSIDRQKSLQFKLAKNIPVKHYARKNLGYLIAISNGADVIIETDDDNIPLENFWDKRTKVKLSYLLINQGWVNIYGYFTKKRIWPRGFSLENILDELPELSKPIKITSPIQQGLADDNPDVDAIYRLTLPLPINFNKSTTIALGKNSICPFNSQNTTWFREAFPLLYLPSYCSFRMTDIWRSFVAQRIAWTCDWAILFHQSTVTQKRNDHSLMQDFEDEIVGYKNNAIIMNQLNNLNLRDGKEYIFDNMMICYQKLIELKLISSKEMQLLQSWIEDCSLLI